MLFKPVAYNLMVEFKELGIKWFQTFFYYCWIKCV